MLRSYRSGGTGSFFYDLEQAPQEKRLLLAANPPRWANSSDVRSLVSASFSLRYSDVRGMARHSELACVLAEALRWKDADHEDARGEAWIQRSAVHRILGDFASSSQDLTRASRSLSRGSQRPDLQARLWEWTGSLFRDRRQFQTAERALSTALKWNGQAGDLADSHRFLVSRAICAGYGGDPKRAVFLAEQAVTDIDMSRQPDLGMSALIALCWFLVDLGAASSAHTCYVESELLVNPETAELVQAHRSWLRAHIDKALSLHESAEILYRRAALGFAHQDMAFDRALVLLDLCGSLAAQDRQNEAAATAAAILPEFLRTGLRRESAACRRWLVA